MRATPLPSNRAPEPPYADASTGGRSPQHYECAEPGIGAGLATFGYAAFGHTTCVIWRGQMQCAACAPMPCSVIAIVHLPRSRICPQMTTMATGCRAISLIKGIEFNEQGPILISDMIKVLARELRRRMHDSP